MAQQSPVPMDEIALAERIIDEVFEVDIESRLPLIGQYIRQMDADPQYASMVVLRAALESLGSLFLGLDQLRSFGNFAQAHEFLHAASNGLNQIGLTDLGHVASATCTYVEAVINAQQLNLGQAVELFDAAKAQLREASKYGQQFEVLIDHMEPDALFLALLGALTQQDFEKAKILSARTFKSAENVAERYYDETEPEYYSFKGIAYCYRSYYTFARSLYDFNQFKYGAFASRPDLASDAVRAQELFERSDLRNVLMQRGLVLSKCIAESMDLLVELAAYLDSIFSAASGAKVYDAVLLDKLKRKAHKATDLASEVGPENVAFVRAIEILGHQLNNLDNLLSRRPIGKSAASQAGSPIPPGEAKIFLVHGHDHGTKETVARFLEHLDLEVTILQDEPARGRTILEKLVYHADESIFAVVLLTADDRGGTTDTPYADQQSRARQNVILELGYFLAALGRERVCAIHKEGVEVPSDYHGVLYVSLDERGAWKLNLARELKAAGIDVDLNKAV